MQFEIKKLITEFENEMWLYLEESLPSERMNFWDEQLRNHPALKKMLGDTQTVLSLYNECADSDINEASYKEMIVNVTRKQNSFLVRVRDLIMNLLSQIFTNYRFAFGAAIIVTVIILISVIEKPGDGIIQTNVSLD